MNAASDKETGFDESEFIVAYELLADLWQKIRLEVPNYDRRKLRDKWQSQVMDMLGHTISSYRDTMPDSSPIPFNYRTEQIPLYLGIYSTDYDTRDEQKKRRKTRHELLQAYIDASDDVAWGVLFNGRHLRLLSDYNKSLTRNYVEADLEAIFDALDVDAFRAVWRLFHGSRFTPSGKGVRPIEMLRDASRQQGASIGKELRRQVRDAIEILGNGFLAADSSGAIRNHLAGKPRECHEFYRSLLLVVYRLLFLLFIENRPSWTPTDNPVWRESYSISRLRERAEGSAYLVEAGEDHWEGLKVVCRVVREGSEFFGIHPYGGELFDDARLGIIADAALSNSALLEALRKLTLFERDKAVQRVNFAHLDLEALGSVYEGLLDVTVTIDENGNFCFAPGADRKLLGSYFTPRSLILELIDSALKPVIEDRVSKVKKPAEQEAALLSIRVVDPSCGSGSFLVEACDALTAKLIEIRLDGEIPDELELRKARRDVVRNCIHGVDVNPFAVDLCRFVLWMHVAHPQFPLSYLEPLIKNGNALVGVPLPSQVEPARAQIAQERAQLLAQGNKRKAAGMIYTGWQDSIPDGAFDAVTGDDKDTAKSAKKANKAQRGGQLTTAAIPATSTRNEDQEKRAKFYAELRDKSDESKDDIEEAVQAYRTYRQSSEYDRPKNQADLWCAAFYQRFTPDTPSITHQWFQLAESGADKVGEEIWAEVTRLNKVVRFFHWSLEFPDVFSNGGFDCVLGNPAWERIKLQEQEFFAGKDKAIFEAPNKSARQKLIDLLPLTNPELAIDFADAKQTSDADSRFLRNSGRFPLTAVGDVNTYALFTETFRVITNEQGRCGIIIPTGIATDDTTKKFFGQIVDSDEIFSLTGYENEENLFSDIHHSFKFCSLILGKKSGKSSNMVFFCRSVEDTSNAFRRFCMTKDDFRLFNPNTKTSPIFRTQVDAALSLFVYDRVPILLHEAERTNEWNVRFQRMFDMANDSSMFSNQDAEDLLPLYEGKMIYNYDHRYSTYEGATQANRNEGSLPQPSQEDKSNPSFVVEPRYWLSNLAVKERTNEDWLMGFRDVTNASVERTIIFSALPLAAVGHKIPLIYLDDVSPQLKACFLASCNSLIVDYSARQKMGGTSLSYFIVKQLPILPPWAYDDEDQAYISQRVLELVYTSWDLQPFARDMGYDGDPYVWDDERRAVLRAELDAYFARLYGLSRKQLRYVLDPHGLSDRELRDILDPWEEPSCSGPDLLPDYPSSSFPGETFRVLKKNELERHGEYRTRRLVLEAWAKLEAEFGPAPVKNYHQPPDEWQQRVDAQKAIDNLTIEAKQQMEDKAQLAMFASA